MITIRPKNERGHANHGWLDSWHTFSFARYHDPEHMGFRTLRVINEDWIQGGAGFGMHPHQDMEIITYVLEGALEHRDSMGNGAVLKAGSVQRMSAGTGVMHSEFNASDSEQLHLYQIWILPSETGVKPSYEDLVPEISSGLTLIASNNRADGSAVIHQDAGVLIGRIDDGSTFTYALNPGRNAWVQVTRGTVDVGGNKLEAGDGAAVTDASTVVLTGIIGGEVLLFDLN